MAKNRAGNNKIPIPWSIWAAALSIVLYSLYLFVFTWAARGKPNVLEGVVLLFTLLLALLMLGGFPFSRVLLLSWSILIGLFLLLALLLADLQAEKTALDWVALVSKLLLPFVNLTGAFLLFNHSAVYYMERKTAKRRSK